MTIALGLIAKDGMVIAADRQQTEGEWKTDQCKIEDVWTVEPQGGCLLTTGAGMASYLDSVSHEIFDHFRDVEEREEKPLFEQIAAINRKFYSRTVIPFAKYPFHERPDYSLLLAYSFRNRCSLWYSELLALNRAEGFKAVGIGKTTAEALLKKFYVLRLPLGVAISLAAFAIYQAKRSIDGCGLETDIYCVRNDVPLRVSPREIRSMEDAFSEFRLAERDDLYQIIGGDGIPQNRKAKDWSRFRRDLHRTFQEFYDRLNKQFNAKTAQGAESKPSASQKSESEL